MRFSAWILLLLSGLAQAAPQRALLAISKVEHQLVMDGFGKIADGTLIGDNLGSAIAGKTGTGVVIDGAARDLDGLSKIENFTVFARDFHPSFLKDMMLSGLNTPVRIGGALVMPGDLVLANSAGVLFIPAHLAETVVRTAEFIDSKDRFGKEVMRSGRFTAAEIDHQWTDAVRDAYIAWLADHPSEPRLNRGELDELLAKRTW